MADAGRRFAGVCYDTGAWDGDLSGLLLVWDDVLGWKHTASHISSSENWSKADIQGHFDRRPDPHENDTYEWVGLLTIPAMESRFGWGKEQRG